MSQITSSSGYMYSLNSTLTSAEELRLGEEETECEQQQRRPQLGHGDGDGVSGPGLGPRAAASLFICSHLLRITGIWWI